MMPAQFVFDTFWLNFTNAALGISTLVLVVVVARAILLELRLRHRR
ncbi:MAG: hypothetical protein P8020_15155 [Acidobacteriota bacterium]|jgi:hypothetical protein